MVAALEARNKAKGKKLGETAALDSVREVPIEEIQTEGLQARCGIDQAIVKEYATLLADGHELPPLRVVSDGKSFWLWDGHHRLAALRKAAFGTAVCQVTEGTRRDAILLACGANAEHGLRRTREDKRRAVEILLRDEEWSTCSDRWIADACRVSHHTVAKMRSDLESPGQMPTCEIRKGQDGKVYKLPEKQSAEPTPRQQVNDFFKDRGTPAVKEADDFESSDSSSGVHASIVIDHFGKPVADHLRPVAAAAAALLSAGRQIEKLRSTLDGLRGQPGVDLIDRHLAVWMDYLVSRKDDLRDARFASECPRCRGNVQPGCDRCQGRGWISRGQLGQLSADETAWLKSDRLQ